MIKFDQPEPHYDLVAHRGYPHKYPDNSLSGIRAALEAGAKFLEIDIQLSTDGTPWLFHDDTLVRVCAMGGSLIDLNDAAIGDLRAAEAERFGAQFANEPIAKLAQVVHLLAEFPEVFVFVEIKPCTVERSGAEQAVAAVARDLEPIAGRCTIISFSIPCLRAVAANTTLPHGIILETWGQLDTDAKEFNNSHIFINYKKLPWDGSIETGTKLAVYEVVDPVIARKLGARGCHFVETFDYPGLAATLKK
jgi:glycerophosphoryl diester phosphodiesterase